MSHVAAPADQTEDSVRGRARPQVRPRTPRTASVLLAGYALLLLGLPQTYAVAGIGFSLTPARMLAGAGLLYWLLCRVGGRRALKTAPNPIRWVLFGALAVWIIAAAVAFGQPLGYDVLPAVDRTVMLLVLSVGVGVLACDGLREVGQIRVVAGAAVLGGSVSAVTALVSFFAGVDLLVFLQLPGLEVGAPLAADLGRSGLERARGTAAHPIELAATCVALLPVAVHLARHGRGRPVWGICAVLLFGAGLTTISRTALLALTVIALLCLPRVGLVRWLGWVAAGIATSLALAAVSPRLAGALSGTVLGSGQDSSVQARLDDYSYVAAQVGEHPLVGQGLGTYQVPQQPYLDNQYLFTAVESGLPGLLALVLLLLVPATLLLRRRHWVHDPTDIRSLAWSVGAGLAACATCFATSDTLSFAQIQGVTFLLIGLAGATWAVQTTAALDADRRVDVGPGDRRVDVGLGDRRVDA